MTEPQTPQTVLTPEFHFPTGIYILEKPEYLDVVRKVSIESLEETRKQQKELNEIYPVCMSGDLSRDPRLKDFTQLVAQCAWEILNSEGYDVKNYGTYFTEFWCQEHHKHSMMEQHVHSYGSQLVGFYFIDCPEKCSMAQFHDPRSGKVQINLPERDMSKVTLASHSVLYPAKEGNLIFAPAWVPHTFTRNGSETPMRFIHFNVGIIPMQNQNGQEPATVV